MTSQNANSFALEHIPDIDIVVFVTRKQESSRTGKGDRGDSAKDVVIGVNVEFTVGAHVEQTAGRVVGTRSECIAVWEESTKRTR